MKVCFLNNQSLWHVGSKAVVDSLMNELNKGGCVVLEPPGARPNIDVIDYKMYDAVVVNGEGTIHHDNWAAEELMKILEVAQKKGLKTYLLNALYQDMDDRWLPVLKKLDGATFREPLSAKEAGYGIEHVYLDSSADRDLLKDLAPEEDFNGDIVVGGAYLPFPEKLPYKHSQFIKNVRSWSDVISNLKTAGFYITGQHHGVYAAALSRTPFVVWDGNSHKTSGLIEWSGIPIPVSNRQAKFNDAIIWAHENLNAYEDFFDWFETKDVTRFEKLKFAE